MSKHWVQTNQKFMQKFNCVFKKCTLNNYGAVICFWTFFFFYTLGAPLESPFNIFQNILTETLEFFVYNILCLLFVKGGDNIWLQNCKHWGVYTEVIVTYIVKIYRNYIIPNLVEWFLKISEQRSGSIRFNGSIVQKYKRRGTRDMDQ